MLFRSRAIQIHFDLKRHPFFLQSLVETERLAEAKHFKMSAASLVSALAGEKGKRILFNFL